MVVSPFFHPLKQAVVPSIKEGFSFSATFLVLKGTVVPFCSFEVIKMIQRGFLQPVSWSLGGLFLQTFFALVIKCSTGWVVSNILKHFYPDPWEMIQFD